MAELQTILSSGDITGVQIDATGSDNAVLKSSEVDTKDASNLVTAKAYTDAAKLTVKDASGNILLPKTSGIGIKVDETTPTFGWRDLKGLQYPDAVGANRPTLSAFRGGNVRKSAYGAGDKMDVEFHIPHDYLPGSDMHIHFHWVHNGTAISGNIVATFSVTYAKGHNQAIYTVEKDVVATYDTVNIATTPRWQHIITEVPLSTSGGAALLLDTDTIEPDGVVSVNFTMTTIPTITGGSIAEPFVDYIDIHYQSTNIPTKQKAPNFYT